MCEYSLEARLAELSYKLTQFGFWRSRARFAYTKGKTQGYFEHRHQQIGSTGYVRLSAQEFLACMYARCTGVKIEADM